MTSKKRLKVIPIYRFFQNMDLVSKLLFVVLFGTMIAAGVLAWISVQDPVQWTLETSSFTSQRQDAIALREWNTHYRTFTTEARAFQEEVTFSSRLIKPVAWLVYAFIAAQVLGWSFMLTGATYIRNWAAYVVVFVFAVFIFLANPFQTFSADGYWLYNGILALLLVVPVFLFQQKIINAPFWLRWLVYLLFCAAPFYLQLQAGSWVDLHNSTVLPYMAMLLITVVFLFFISTDFTNLIFYLGTNAKNRKYRVGMSVMLAFWLVLAALEFVVMQDYLGWDLFDLKGELPLRPMYLLVVAAAISVGTKQAMYPVLKHFVNNRAMSFMIVSLALLALSYVAYVSAMGEYLFIYAIERLTITIFFLAGTFHFFYMVFNFGPLIQARINFYYLTMMPKRLMYFFVIVAAAGFTFAIEASDNNQSIRVAKGVFNSRLGDQQLLMNNLPEAMSWYNLALNRIKGDPKTNYNMGLLKARNDDFKHDVPRHLQDACNFIEFPYAYLMLGNFYIEEIQLNDAKRIWQQGMERAPHAMTASNLAAVYEIDDQPDSAVIYLKQALKLDPTDGGLYANLASVYLKNQKVEEARQFVEAGLEQAPAHPALLTNALLLNLKHQAGIQVDPASFKDSAVVADRGTMYNYALWLYQEEKYDQVQAIMADMLAEGQEKGVEYTDALYLDGMAAFGAGNVLGAASRMQYIGNDQVYGAMAHHFMGVAYYDAGVPGMAEGEFLNAVLQGRRSDLLNAARMQMAGGDLEGALLTLKNVRVQDSTQLMPSLKEESMLQLSQGEYLVASIGFDMSTLTADDWALIGIYAGRSGKQPAALEAFRNLIALDSTSVVPYLEMGRISIANGDTLALENLEPGLRLEPDHLELRIEEVRARRILGQRDRANELTAKLMAEAPDNPEVMLLQAERALSQQDTTAAIELLDTLRVMQPLDTRPVLTLSAIRRAQGDPYAAFEIMDLALNLNKRNPDLYLELAYVYRDLFNSTESGYCAMEAQKFSGSLDRIRAIGEEFEKEIDIFLNGYPDEEPLFE